MENEKKSNGTLVGLFIGVILTLIVFCCLFATGTIGLKTNTTNNNGQINENNQTNENNNSITNDSNTVEQESNISEEQALRYVSNLSEKTFSHIRQEAYCGTNMNWGNTTDVIKNENGFPIYVVSKDFASLKDLKDYLSGFWSSNFISKSMNVGFINGNKSIEKYKEKDGKLYCYTANKDCAPVYNSEKSTFTIKSVDVNTIVASGKVVSNSCGGYLDNTDTTIKIIKENNNWVVDDYTETFIDSVYVGENN